MEAINVLERFSLKQAEQEIREKMDNMRDAVMRGVRLSEIQVYRDTFWCFYQCVTLFVRNKFLLRCMAESAILLLSKP